MHYLLIVLFIVVTPEAKCNQTDPEGIVKIIGGNRTDITAVKYQVSIRDGLGYHFCGGSIINEYHVVTAAHCVTRAKRKGNIFCVVGENYSTGGQLNPVVHIAVHPMYDKSAIKHDVAVLKTKNKIQLNNYTIGAVALANSTPPDGTHCIVSGWGSLIEELFVLDTKTVVMILARVTLVVL
ncbi:trypsin theta-like isoform X2 [Cimex lectularius]|uniref:Peptidase S1 domain-containing protein n=1 Tax=Cimex lectularius TaxID=79782 RepID=A0A8I6SED0_CIMLE|nr:trypsin theta-like isoform X2 [Cimex lectularius]